MAKFNDVAGYTNCQSAIMANLTDQSVVSSNLADIAESVGDLVTQNTAKDKKIEELTAYNTRLIEQNGNLLMRVPAGTETPKNNNPLNPPADTKIKLSDIVADDGKIK